jgi:hypothetical protein
MAAGVEVLSGLNNKMTDLKTRVVEVGTLFGTGLNNAIKLAFDTAQKQGALASETLASYGARIRTVISQGGDAAKQARAQLLEMGAGQLPGQTVTEALQRAMPGALSVFEKLKSACAMRKAG